MTAPQHCPICKELVHDVPNHLSIIHGGAQKKLFEHFQEVKENTDQSTFYTFDGDAEGFYTKEQTPLYDSKIVMDPVGERRVCPLCDNSYGDDDNGDELLLLHLVNLHGMEEENAHDIVTRTIGGEVDLHVMRSARDWWNKVISHKQGRDTWEDMNIRDRRNAINAFLRKNITGMNVLEESVDHDSFPIDSDIEEEQYLEDEDQEEIPGNEELYVKENNVGVSKYWDSMGARERMYLLDDIGFDGAVRAGLHLNNFSKLPNEIKLMIKRRKSEGGEYRSRKSRSSEKVDKYELFDYFGFDVDDDDLRRMGIDPENDTTELAQKELDVYYELLADDLKDYGTEQFDAFICPLCGKTMKYEVNNPEKLLQTEKIMADHMTSSHNADYGTWKSDEIIKFNPVDVTEQEENPEDVIELDHDLLEKDIVTETETRNCQRDKIKLGT